MKYRASNCTKWVSTVDTFKEVRFSIKISDAVSSYHILAKSSYHIEYSGKIKSAKKSDFLDRNMQLILNIIILNTRKTIKRDHWLDKVKGCSFYFFMSKECHRKCKFSCYKIIYYYGSHLYWSMTRLGTAGFDICVLITFFNYNWPTYIIATESKVISHHISSNSFFVR